MTATLTLTIGKRRYQVASIGEASRMFCAARDKAGLGSSKTPKPLIFNADGSLLGHISYNGRVWAGRDYVPGATPLCEAVYADDAAT